MAEAGGGGGRRQRVAEALNASTVRPALQAQEPKSYLQAAVGLKGFFLRHRLLHGPHFYKAALRKRDTASWPAAAGPVVKWLPWRVFGGSENSILEICRTQRVV